MEERKMYIELSSFVAEKMKKKFNIKNTKEKERIAKKAYIRGKLIGYQKGLDGDTKTLIEYSNYTYIYSSSGLLITILPKYKYKKNINEIKFKENLNSYKYEYLNY